ncbi:DUF3108 domain-containing protein [Varunaivibrio sulfuroxidans]|uniref:Uncharacterized protein DUF3108 n=1 Tax=Varunaivibrio sulfuroxidans TaxID=1773489 RepID=A0A4V2UNR6_9PROT|nr:DUF3108 domain-containing protein [Varunaivibrio sulfuroxidans]TCS63061.1 uncharacterized protein DUF3108 [Varunaivibrio sulfuroxidans]WES31867.1 DUF3108 domain-containing protein [Varunaivibrio sulfuroxidans]
MRRLFCTITGAVLCATVFVGVAPSPGLARTTYLRYQANWSGLHVADFTLGFDDEKGRYVNTFHLVTRGLLGWFTRFDIAATATGLHQSPPGNDAAATYTAQEYRVDYTTKNALRWIKITFSAPHAPAHARKGSRPLPGHPGKIENKAADKDIPARLRTDVTDPLSALSQLIEGVREHLSGGPANFSIAVFDGKRRLDLKARYLGPITRTIMEKKYPAYRLRVETVPIMGFKKSHKILWDGATFDLYLSRDDLRIMQIVPIRHGPVLGPVLTLERTCSQPCPLPKAD